MIIHIHVFLAHQCKKNIFFKKNFWGGGGPKALMFLAAVLNACIMCILAKRGGDQAPAPVRKLCSHIMVANVPLEV